MGETQPSLEEIEASRKAAETEKDGQAIEYVDTKTGIRHEFKTKEELMNYTKSQIEANK